MCEDIRAVGPRIAVMQPYLFPYLGYFQLVHCCDEFILFDDVQYIKRGWVNRNYLLLSGEKYRFTASVVGASRSKTFNEVQFESQDRLLITIASAYRKAPYFECAFPLIERILRFAERRVALLVRYSLTEILGYVGIEKSISLSSALRIPPGFRGAARILEICRIKKSTSYVNAPGGVALYDSNLFAAAGVELHFLKPGRIHYQQFGGPFIENLSIIDVLMFNPPTTVLKYVQSYELSR